MRDIYLKNGVSKYIPHLIKRANFQLYRAYRVGVIWKNLYLPTNIYTNEFNFFEVKQTVFPK